ncbi:MAG: cohesin domain-containing protein [Pyrinomonadaceae bacterium]
MTMAQKVRSRRTKALTFALIVFAVGGLSLSTVRARVAGGGVFTPPSSNDQVTVANFLPPCSTVTISNTITTRRNVSVTAPIMVSDLTGLGVLSFDFNLTYDPAVLTAPVVSNAGTLSSMMVITVNPNTPGVLRVSGYYQDFMAGAGTMLNISFTAIGPIGSASDLVLSPYAFNEGNPCSIVTNGRITIVSGTVSGAITYSNAQSPPVPVPNVLVSAAGSIPASTNTNFSGLYSFGGFGAGPYTVTPSKTGDVNGITGFDSALIAQHVVLLITLTPTQLLAADVSQNNQVTGFDAALIAQYIVLIPNIGNTGSWIFSPPNRAYGNLEADFVNQDHGAILMGEVSGNWVAPTMFARPAVPEIANLSVTAPAVTALADQSITIPAKCGDTTGLNILAYQFDLRYDPAVITPQPDPISTVGTISEGMFATSNPVSPGLLKVVLFATTPRVGAGTLVNLKFTAVGPPGAVSPLTWVDFKWDEGNPGAIATNGQVRLLSPTVAGAVVRGRLLTATGQAVPNTRVNLIGINGGSRTVISSGFGYFEFAGVTAGQTYTITAEGRRFSFAPRVLTVGNDVTDFDLFADP